MSKSGDLFLCLVRTKNLGCAAHKWDSMCLSFLGIRFWKVFFHFFYRLIRELHFLRLLYMGMRIEPSIYCHALICGYCLVALLLLPCKSCDLVVSSKRLMDWTSTTTSKSRNPLDLGNLCFILIPELSKLAPVCWYHAILSCGIIHIFNQYYELRFSWIETEVATFSLDNHFSICLFLFWPLRNSYPSLNQWVFHKL